MFKDKQARRDIADLEKDYYDLFIERQRLNHKLLQLASTLGYEYKEESKEAGWVKKLPEVYGGVITYTDNGVGSGTNAGIAFQEVKPKKTKSK